MGHAIQWLRSLVFVALMYLALGVLGLIGLPYALASRDGALRMVHLYTGLVRAGARILVGLRTEVRGEVPQDPVLIAAKHQSFLDILLITDAVPRPRFIMKSVLRWAPVLGWYAMRIGCVPVDRGRRAAAIAQMKAGVAAGLVTPGQLVIYPQGTRIAPGVKAPYKVGAGVLYDQLGQDCVPVATNVGVFWPKRGIYRRRGLAVVEFLPRIPAGMPLAAFMAELETLVERESDRLIAEAHHGQ